MKVKGILTTGVALLCAASAITTGTVFAAAESQTNYPADFERELTFSAPIKDYAVFGDTVAYAYNTSISILAYDDSGDKKRTDFIHASEIAFIDYAEDGKLYFRNTSGGTYLYSNELIPVESHEFQSLTGSKIELSENVFYTLNDKGVLTYWNGNVDVAVDEGGFSLMKVYDNTIYAVKDNCLYKIEESTASAISLAYTDFKGADNISAGNVSETLKSGDYRVKTAIINKGTYVTEIDPEQIGTTFKQLSTKKTESDIPCLVLCESGNASVITTNEGCFVTATANLTEYAYEAPVNDWKVNDAGVRAAYAVENVGIYSSPYMSGSTRIGILPSGAEHYVTVEEKFALDFLDKVYYRVTYTENDKTVSGFVAANFLTEYNFAADDKKPVEGGDDEFKYDTNVTSVILAVLIVGLVIIAILYLTMVGSKKDQKVTDKKAKKKKQSKKSDEIDD